MQFTKIPEDTFESIQLNEGIVCKTFDPKTNVFSDMIGAAKADSTSFNATPTFSDFGEDIANCPKNMKELKKLDSWDIKLGVTLVSVTAATIKMGIAAADVDEEDETHIIPRNDVIEDDFDDLWWVGDYSDKNTGTKAGYIAVHMMNTLSTGGLSIKPGDKKKGEFAMEFTAHYSMDAQDKVPFEVYVKAGTE